MITPIRNTINDVDCKTFTTTIMLFQGWCAAKGDEVRGARKELHAVIEQRTIGTNDMGAIFEVHWGHARRRYNYSDEAIEFYNSL